MSIVRLYREQTGEDGARRLEYREAWHDEAAGELVVHHGRVGTVGTTGDQRVRDAAEAEELLAAFALQGAEEGFAELDESALQVLSVTLRLRGRTATSMERRHADALRDEVTHQLAWRGLGEVVDVTEDAGRLVLTVLTPHAGRAEAEVPAAARRADGVQPNKVEVHRGDLRPAGASAPTSSDAAATTDAADAALRGGEG